LMNWGCFVQSLADQRVSASVRRQADCDQGARAPPAQSGRSDGPRATRRRRFRKVRLAGGLENREPGAKAGRTVLCPVEEAGCSRPPSFQSCGPLPQRVDHSKGPAEWLSGPAGQAAGAVDLLNPSFWPVLDPGDRWTDWVWTLSRERFHWAGPENQRDLPEAEPPFFRELLWSIGTG